MAPNLRVAVLLGRGSNPTEFDYSRLRLREASLQATVVGLDRRRVRLEDHSIGCADALIDQVAGEAFDGVVVPGGLGPEKLRQNAGVLALVADCYRRSKLCAAICHGQQVLISAGLLRGRRATAAWSMLDDLRAVGAIVPAGVRAVRDGQIVTAIFPDDLPEFFRLIFQALAELEGYQPPPGYPGRLAGQTWGIAIDDASDAVQVAYLRLRVQEEGGQAVLIGRRAGQRVPLGSPADEWGERGLRTEVQRALPDPGVIGSCDSDAELNSRAIRADELDGLLLPGGLGTWMIRGHPGLQALVREMDAAGKPIGAVGRGPKVLLATGVLAGQAVTCAPQIKDDLLYAVAPIEVRDIPVVRSGHLLTCSGTEALPDFMRVLIETWAPG